MGLAQLFTGVEPYLQCQSPPSFSSSLFESLRATNYSLSLLSPIIFLVFFPSFKGCRFYISLTLGCSFLSGFALQIFVNLESGRAEIIRPKFPFDPPPLIEFPCCSVEDHSVPYTFLKNFKITYVCVHILCH